MTTIRTTIRSLCCLAAGLGLVACSGANWKSGHVAPGYQTPKQLALTVGVSAKGEGLDEAVAEFTKVLQEELSSRKISATVVSGQVTPPALEISIVEWEPGSRALRYLVSFGAGEGHLTGDAKVTSEQGQPVLEGQVYGWVRGGAFGGSALVAAQAAAKAVAVSIATGRLSE